MKKNLTFLAASLFAVVAIWPLTSNLVLGQTALTATITTPANNATLEINQAINFSASASGGSPSYGFLWNFGDGTTGAGSNFTKTYTTAGAKTVQVTVTDFDGTQAVASINLTINASPAPVPLSASITTPANNATLEINQAINFSASASGGSPSYGFLWNFGDGTTGAGANFTKTYTATGTKTVILTVKDTDGQEAISSITIAVTTPPIIPEPDSGLTISNIRVTDITSTSAVIRWTTNNPATSRVIYDIASHSSIVNQSAPNFGYASSTATTDVDSKVTEHAVTVNNLSSATHYYFRVISQ